MTDKFSKEVQDSFTTFVPTTKTKFDFPNSESEIKKYCHRCFSYTPNNYRPSPEQQYFISLLVRMGGYSGRLVVNGYGQFFQDVKGFYVKGVKLFLELIENE